MPGQSELGHRGPVVYRCAHDTGCLVQSSDTGRARRLVIDLDMVYSTSPRPTSSSLRGNERTRHYELGSRVFAPPEPGEGVFCV